jgi:DNA invertase Pin-like site-specific DNA recombinase
MPTAYSYLRFSSPEQAKGDSITRQTEARDAWLAEHPDVTLDTALVMTDAGRSGYDRKDGFDTYALGAFVDLVKRGRVPGGSYLLVENLDRLSREDAGTATELLLSIVNRGVAVVQLKPVVMEFRKPVEMMKLMYAIMELSRGHSESQVKSTRLVAAWKRKQEAAATGKRVTRLLPCWIKLDGEKLVIDPVAGAVVKRIARMVLDRGMSAIARQLREEGVPVLGRTVLRGKPVKWSVPTVHAILTSRALIGEYVPYGPRNRTKKPAGPPVPNYFPALLTPAEFQRVQDALQTRNLIGRGRGGHHVNLFGGLLVEALSERTLTYARCSSQVPRLVPVGTGDWCSFPAGAFETAVLRKMGELTSADIEGTPDDSATDRVKSLMTRRRELTDRIAALRLELETGDIPSIAQTLRKLEADRVKVVGEIESAERASASPVTDALGAIRTLADVLAEKPDDDTRRAIRAALRRVIREVRVLVVKKGVTRWAAVRVGFRPDGDRHRDYLLRYVAPDRHGHPEKVEAESFADAALPGELDLRDPKQARDLEVRLRAALGAG